MKFIKSRTWIILMSCVLTLLVVRLFVMDAQDRAEQKKQKGLTAADVASGGAGELEVMAELENNIVSPVYTVNGKEKVPDRDSIAGTNQSGRGDAAGGSESTAGSDQSCAGSSEEGSGTTVGTDQSEEEDENSSAMEQGSRYADLYPDMYVTQLDPPEMAADDKIAYLTFDDGPSDVTGNILDTLDKEGIKGTFFILGSTMTKEGEENLKRMAEEGHTIGIHTYSHEYKDIYASVEGFLEDFHKVYEQVVELTGVKPTIFRFPWGSYNKYCKNMKAELVAEMERRGFTYYDWNVSAEDSVGKPTSQSIIKNVKKDLTKYTKPVILMHDSMNNKLTAQTLPDIISLVKQNGYTFDTLDHREPCQFSY